MMDTPPTETSIAFKLLTTTRYDEALLTVAWNSRINGGTPAPFMLLPYHFDRLAAAAEQHGWTQARQNAEISRLRDVCEQAVRAARAQHGSSGPFRLRVLLAHDGTFSATAGLVTALATTDPMHPDETVDAARIVYVDPEVTPTSIFTSTKTTNRHMYESARARVGLTPMPTPADSHIDVLLRTSSGLVLETSIRNIAFRRNDQWVTPSLGSGCQSGVMRRLMLEEGRFVEGDIQTNELVDGELAMTANGVDGCRYARLKFITPSMDVS